MALAGTPALVFVLDDDQFCVDNHAVANVLTDADLRPTDSDEQTAVGELAVRGTPVTVLDVARLFGVPPDRDTTSRQVIVFNGLTEGRGVGWLVDDVRNVVRLDETDLSDPPRTARHIRGHLRYDGRTTIWLDADSINDRPASTEGGAAGDAGTATSEH
jgi:chemotaxis signal transduction protein